MLIVTLPVLLVLAGFALRGQRWAYAAFIATGLTSFAARTGFRLLPQPCELAVGLQWVLVSFTNYWHIVIFTLFFILSHAQVRSRGVQGFLWAAATTLLMGAVLEMAQALTGSGHCRLRDLIPDTVGAVLGMFLVLLWQRVATQITATSPTPRAP